MFNSHNINAEVWCRIRLTPQLCAIFKVQSHSYTHSMDMKMWSAIRTWHSTLAFLLRCTQWKHNAGRAEVVRGHHLSCERHINSAVLLVRELMKCRIASLWCQIKIWIDWKMKILLCILQTWTIAKYCPVFHNINSPKREYLKD